MGTERFKGGLLLTLLITLVLVAAISLMSVGNQDRYPLMNPVVAEIGGVDVSITPALLSAPRHTDLTFVATLKNTGTAWDRFTLALSDDLGWPNLSWTQKTAKLHPIDDAYVYENQPNTNYGTNKYLRVGAHYNTKENGGERSFLKFDLGGILSEVAIQSAKLNLYYDFGTCSDNITVDICEVSDDSWTEGTITWNTQPAYGSVLYSELITKDDYDKSLDADVTSYVLAEMASDNKASFALVSKNEDNVWEDVDFRSDEGFTRPYLRITYAAPETSLMEIPAGGENSLYFMVTIPDNALYCTYDTLTVTATSNLDPSVSDNDIALAHCTGAPPKLRGVEVQISPSYQSASVGGALSYFVEVRNMGYLDDSYALTVSDNSGWSLTLSENFLENVRRSERRDIMLSVIISENAEHCTEDLITVWATGTLATGDFPDPDNAAAFDTCICIAHRSKAEFNLTTLYIVALDVDFYVGTGSRLVAKFYTYGDAYENESIFWSGTAPVQVTKFENVPHPEGKPIEIVRLDLTTDNTENVISTIASFVVNRSRLITRISQIKSLWPFASPPERSALISEISGIKSQWPFAPS